MTISSVRGQDPVPPVAQTPLDDASLSSTAQLILRSVRDGNPQTAEELVTAIQVLLDIELFDDARFYIAQMETLGLDDENLFASVEAAGSDFFSLIAAHPQLQPEGRRVARKFLVGAKSVAMNPERIRELILILNDPDISVRSEAFRKLRLIGQPAVAEMLNAFADESRKPEYPGIRGALKQMGVAAQEPLLGGARSSNLMVQAESIRALGNYESSEALDVMMRAYLSPKMPEYMRRLALDSLHQEQLPADPSIVEERFYNRSRRYLLGERQGIGAMLGRTTLWNWDETTRQMLPTEVDSETASRVIAAQRAADLYEIQPELARNRELYLLTQLEAAKRLVGQDRRVDADQLAKKITTSPGELETVLEQALELELVPAAIACCELLAKLGTEDLLTGSIGRPRPLIQAILFGDRHLQFAAFEAIAEIDPQQAYAGSSYMVSLAVFLAQSEKRPAGLVGHNREDLAQSYAATLSTVGLFGQSVTTSREFFRAATTNPDIEVLLVTDTLQMPDYAELIQQLRNDWRTRRIPIALLYRDLERNRRAVHRIGNGGRFAGIPFSTDPIRVAQHVEQLREMAQPWGVTNLDRRRHAGAAIRWLAKVSADRKQYPFYSLGSLQDQLARLIYLPGFSGSASTILANLGTPKAQRELVNFASQTGQPLDERKKVVEAFALSVKNGGTLLTRDEIKQQYERYNASSTESVEIQQVLGLILDVIEGKSKDPTD